MAAQQQQQGSDNSLAPLWIIMLVFILGMTVWYFAHSYIVAGVFSIKYYEALLLSFFTSSLDGVINLLKTTDTMSVSFDEMMYVSQYVGEYTRYPISIILIIFGVILYRCDITSKYKRTYDMQALRNAEAEMWPQIMPVVNLDLVNEDIGKGPWAMATPPLEFAIRHRILKKEIIITNTKGRTKKEGRYAISKGEAKRIFTMQLGDYYEGVDALRPHVKALFAMFAAKLCRDRAGCVDLAKQINISAGKGKLNFSGVDELLKKHKDHKDVRRVCNRHAYVATVMASLLDACRADGVLPSSEFLWLKPLDRRLWFTLNMVGRQTPFTEVAGIFAHWIAEKELKRKCLVPMVDEAVKGLELAIQEIKYNPEDDEEV